MATELKPPMSLMNAPDAMMLLFKKKKDKIPSFSSFSLGFVFCYILGASICVRYALKRTFSTLQYYSRAKEHQSMNQHWVRKRTYSEFCFSGCVQKKNCT